MEARVSVKKGVNKKTTSYYNKSIIFMLNKSIKNPETASMVQWFPLWAQPPSHSAMNYA